MSSNERMPADSGLDQPFGIQPHPAKTNNPEDLKKDGTEQVTEGNAQNVFRQGFIPGPEQVKNMEEPISKEQLRTRTAELDEAAHKSSNRAP